LQLTHFERLVLLNQYRLLKLVDPTGERSTYATYAEILEGGFEGEYHRIEQTLSEPPLSETECSEAIDILEMMSVVHRVYDALHDKSGVRNVRYKGFAGNSPEELRYLAYARFLTGTDGRWSDLKNHDNHNSHFPSLPGYRAMLAVWKSLPDKHDLTKEQLAKVVAAWHL
jgi:uncharacterized protein YfbU (UPF0304 family)